MVLLSAQARDVSVAAKAMRRNKQVPCVVYGHDVQNTPIQCDLQALHKAFVSAGESTLVQLDVAGKKVPVLFKDVSFDPVSGNVMHADFFAVNMKEEIETKVPVHVTGESPAVKDLGAILVTPVSEVTVKCLPSDLPPSLEVSIVSLAQFHDVLTIKDLKLPKGVKILEDEGTVLATVQEPRKEEVVIAAPAEGEAAAGAESAAAAAPGAESAAPAADAKAAEGDKAEKKK